MRMSHAERERRLEREKELKNRVMGCVIALITFGLPAVALLLYGEAGGGFMSYVWTLLSLTAIVPLLPIMVVIAVIIIECIFRIRRKKL